MSGPVRRREVLRAAAGAAALALGPGLARGHTPYRQWLVYRKRYLHVLAHKGDPRAFALARAVAEILAAALPESRARPSRAADPRRLASLLGTGQMDVAVLAAADAPLLGEGRAPYDSAGPVALDALYRLGDHLLVSRRDFPAAHAYLIVEALERRPDALPADPAGIPADGAAGLALHPGAARLRAGEGPPAGAGPGEADDHGHAHSD